eukprot:2061983-Pyramimonas_sp.AAC.1
MHECTAVPLPQGADTWGSLPPTIVANIRLAAASFPTRAALGQLAFNPKALNQVSSDGLEVLASLFM